MMVTTNLGIKTAMKNAAIKISIQAFAPGVRRLLVRARAPEQAEKNKGAIPTAGKGFAVMIPYGKSRAKPGMKASKVTMRSWR